MRQQPTDDELENLIRELVLPFHEIKRELKLPTRDRNWENDAEHSWSLAFLACALAPEIDSSLDVGKIAQLALVHDLVEVYAGDLPVLKSSTADQISKAQHEQEALKKIETRFSRFPWIARTIHDYESKVSAEARFVYALDKYIPVAYDYIDEGVYLREAKHTKTHYDLALKTHRTKAHTHPDIGRYYDEIRKKLDAHPEYFYEES